MTAGETAPKQQKEMEIMSEIVERKQGTEIAEQSEQNVYIRYGQMIRRTRIIGKLLKYSRHGEWTAGEDNIEIPADAEFVVKMDSWRLGWLKWEDNRPVDEVMGYVKDEFKPPRRSELGDTDRELWEAGISGAPRDPWQFSNSIVLMDQAGELYTYATGSNGGVQAIGTLAEAYGQAMRHRPDEWPVVTLVPYEWYNHREFGKTFKPAFKIVRWVSKDSIDNALNHASEGYEQEQEMRTLEQAPVPSPAKPGGYKADAKPKSGPSAAKLPKARF